MRVNKILVMLMFLCLMVQPSGASADPARSKWRVLFAGRDATGKIHLWVTDGTAAGTSEVNVGGSIPQG